MLACLRTANLCTMYKLVFFLSAPPDFNRLNRQIHKKGISHSVLYVPEVSMLALEIIYQKAQMNRAVSTFKHDIFIDQKHIHCLKALNET